MLEKAISGVQLLRLPYRCTVTQELREFLVYLPDGYESEPETRWPVLVFLHGAGERGDGREDLDYVLRHGPLGEAWLRYRDLPFIMIGPQLPVFGQHQQVALRDGVPRPERLSTGPVPYPDPDRPAQPMMRAPDPTPAEFGITETWGDEGPPGGWQLYRDEVLRMVDRVLTEYRGDPTRVYLTGLSYGGYGTWDLAGAHPERWAAIAPICGDASRETAKILAARQVPLWIFHGGRDNRIKPHWIYDIANALEQAGHQDVRLTVHEDLGHDCWTRIYGGWDLYEWLLSHQLDR